MQWRTREELVCNKTLLEKGLFNWDVWFLHLPLISQNARLSLAGDCESLRADMWLWCESWQLPQIQTFVWPCDRGWVRQHRCKCLPGLDCPGVHWSWPAHHVSHTQSSHSAVCAQSPLQPLWMCHCTAERTVLSAFESKPHMNTSLKKPT